MKPATLTLLVYRVLARAFPREFRQAHGDQMLHLTEAIIDEVWRREGMRGLFRLLADIAVRVPIEHATELRQDVIYGWRTLIASPGFTATTVTSLSLAICGAAAAFSTVNGLILGDVPGIADRRDLVGVKEPVSYPVYEQFSRRSDLFASTTAWMPGVAFDLQSERSRGHIVTHSYFSVLRPSIVVGRVPEVAEAAVVISTRLWRDRFGSDPAITNRSG